MKLEPGLQVLKIFKDHVCKTSLLDDFDFYDNREKMMQERKAKHQQLKKVWNLALAFVFCYSVVVFKHSADCFCMAIHCMFICDISLWHIKCFHYLQ